MGIALSGGINIWTQFDGSTRSNFIDGMAQSLLMAGWELTDSVPASVSHTYGSQPSNGSTLLAGKTYTFVITLNNAADGQVFLGATLADTLQNLIDCINLGTGAGTEYSTATTANTSMSASLTGTTVTLLSAFPGPTGNGTPSDYGALLGGGYKVTGTSPQTDLAGTLSTKAYIHDKQFTLGSNALSNVQMLNAAETIASNLHLVSTVPGRRYRVVANRCQFFCYRVGVANDGTGSTICGGVTYIAPSTSCAGDVPQAPVDFSFWVSNDYNANVGNNNTTPRTTLNDFGGGHWTRLDQYAQVFKNFNDNVTGWAASDAAYEADLTLGDFRIMSMSTSLNYTLLNSGSLIDSMRWHGGNGQLGRRMLLEPIVAWVPSGGGTPQIRGQLWDAWISTDTVPMDTVQQFADGRWYVAFTNNNAFGTLWLLVPGPNPLNPSGTNASYAN